MRDAEAYVPCPVAVGVEIVHTPFETTVAHCTHILVRSTEVAEEYTGHGELHEDVGGLLVEPVERGGDAVVPESEVDTEVPCAGCLPADIVVRHRGGYHTGLLVDSLVEEIVARCAEGGSVGIVAYLLVAELTP